MNPDKLFDYLDGRLPAAERAALEKQLIWDRQLQRELVVARQIQAGMHGDSREVLLPSETDTSARGRKLALRIGVAFVILMGVNVGVGLWLIARNEAKNPNRALLETQMRQQITKALEHAATTLTPAPLGVSQITIVTTTGRLNAVADEIVTIVGQLGGSATKGLPDQHRLSVLVDLPGNHESEFRAVIASIAGDAPIALLPSPAETVGPSPEKKSFVVEIIEGLSEQH
ncbi:MAG TPA: hypothetical protein VGI41_09645 [Candidatus Udaeobacter sp.]|jgi:hypothetical protein